MLLPNNLSFTVYFEELFETLLLCLRNAETKFSCLHLGLFATQVVWIIPAERFEHVEKIKEVESMLVIALIHFLNPMEEVFERITDADNVPIRAGQKTQSFKMYIF